MPVRSPTTFLAAPLLATLALACSVTTTSDPGDGPGAMSPDGGVDPASCAGDGTLAVRITGVPAGATAKVTVEGGGRSSVVAADETLTLASGDHAVTAADIVVADPVVRTVYRATVSTSSVRVCGGGAPATVDVAFSPVPSSGKVWASNSNGSAYVLGFASSVLGATSEQPATVAAKTQGRGGIAFDRDGNLWAIGATTTDPSLVRYPASGLGASGPQTPDREIDLRGTGCGPGAHSLAFDPAGNLWVSVLCAKQVVRLTANELSADGAIAPSVVVSNLTGPRGIAFDGAGNLWVADGAVRRFDAARLATSTDAPADAALTIADADSEALAFDANGDLWSVGGSEINLAHLAKAELGAPGARDVVPAATLSVGVSALPNGIAFDESGGLWLATSGGRFARLAPSQLGTSTTYAAPTVPERVIASPDVGSAGSFALYPAPAALPLYHRAP